MSVDLRLAVPAATAWAGVAILVTLPDGLPAAAVLCWVCAVGVVTVAFLARRVQRFSQLLATIALACACLALVASAAAARQPTRQPQELLDGAEAGWRTEMVVMTTETVLPGAASFAVELLSVSLATHEIRGRIPARVIGGRIDGEVPLGSTLAVVGTLRTTDPGDATAFLVFPRAPPEVTAPPPVFLAVFAALRSDFRSVASTLPGDGGALLPGLAIGDTSAVGPDLDTAMKQSSLSHLTAVSGANCAIVVGLVMLFGRTVGLGRGMRVALSVVALGGFVVLVTPEPSVLRAAVMALVVLGTVASGRALSGLPVLALAVLVLLVIDPWLSREYGFVLSVLATGGLLLLARPLAVALSRVLPFPIAAIIAVPLSAQLACQPVLILLAPSIPTYGVLANLLAGPAAPIATVLGLVACLVTGPAPQLAHLIARFAWLPAEWVGSVARFFAGAPGSRLPSLQGAFGVLTVSLFTAVLLLSVLPGIRRTVRQVAIAAVAITVIGYLGIGIGAAARLALTRPTDWQFASCDVGQGDATVVTNGGRFALIDAGPDGDKVLACLDDLGVGRLDLLVLTHFDRDHVGGSTALLGRVDTVLTGPVDRADGAELLDRLAEGGATVTAVARGDEGRLGDLRWRIMWPTDPLRGTKLGNDASVTLLIDGVGACPNRCLSGIFLGDLGESPQDRMAAVNRLPTVDVVKVAHHGSADQSPRLYDRLGSTAALIGVGSENTYGHPTEGTLEMLREDGTAIARTDRDGLVLVSPGEDGTLGVWRERGG